MTQASADKDVSLESLVAGVLDEFRERLARGERPDIEEYVARHPEAADLLRKVLASLLVLDDSLSVGPGTAGAGDDLTGTLGDFRLIREVGRGGMGIVYEAEQMSLGRRVALKVLPFAATMDPRQLQRFHNEARAAASLHHERIVPVYAVAQERGVHYYAMQFIEGQTLAAMIQDLRQVGGRLALRDEQPTTPHVPGQSGAAAAPDTARLAASTEGAPGDQSYFRRVAELGVQAAEALDHAHTMGVVHRDIKPANLLLDGRGCLWVTDFGLAHVQSDARLTMTGDLVGTLRYMSPEQALAKRVVIDQRTDIYSLGVTLYELLTLQPAYSGSDRQELLRQIAFEEPRPPRRLNRAVPAELEIIVQKAAAKNPQERYATAQELADDLQRFLNHEPIRARRPSLAQRARNWARRHPAAVRASAAVLLVLAASAGWGVRDWAARRAETARVVAEAIDEADRLRKERRLSEALSAARRAEGLLAQGGGHADLEPRVRQMLADLRMLRSLEEARLRMADVTHGFFDAAAADEAYTEAFHGYGIDVSELGPAEIGERVAVSAIRVELAAGLDHWALVRRDSRGPGFQGWTRLLAAARAADPDEWRDQIREAVERQDFKALANLAAPGRAEALPVPTLLLLARTLIGAGKGREATALLREGQRRYPGDLWLNYLLAESLRELNPAPAEEAIGYYRAALALRTDSPAIHNALGSALEAKGRLDEAIASFNEAIRLKPDYAEPYNNLGISLKAKGRLDEAIACYNEALRLQPGLAVAHNNLGVALKAKGRLDEAIVSFKKAIRPKRGLALAHANLGLALEAKGCVDEAIASYNEAIRLKPDFVEAHHSLGRAFHVRGRLDEAIVRYNEAIRLKPDFAEVHGNLGIALQGKGRVDEAMASFREALRLKPDLALPHNYLGLAFHVRSRLDEAIACYNEAIRLKPDFAEAHYNLGVVLHDKGRVDEAIARYNEAIRLDPDYAEAHGNLGTALRQKGEFAAALASLRRCHELGSKSTHWHHPSGQWVKICERLIELAQKLPAVLNGERQPADPTEAVALAEMALIYKRLPAAAARLYQESFAARPTLADERNGHRYNAACAAALAGCGQGNDAAKLDDTERARLREQARAWLRADLKAWEQLRASNPDKARSSVVQQMQHWQRDPDLAGVRDEPALKTLPAAERDAWQKLWNEVQALADVPELLPPPRTEPMGFQDSTRMKGPPTTKP